MWFMKKRLKTTFKGDNVKALIKRQIVKNWKKVQKIAALLC